MVFRRNIELSSLVCLLASASLTACFQPPNPDGGQAVDTTSGDDDGDDDDGGTTGDEDGGEDEEINSDWDDAGASSCQRGDPPRDDERDASQDPPNGLDVDNVPMFVTLGFDDNSRGDGIEWILDYVAEMKNPEGTENEATFDGAPVRATFYNTSMYAVKTSAKAGWKRAYAEGHEIGNHTKTHMTTKKSGIPEWRAEVQVCIDVLTEKIEVPCDEIYGFRAPRLETNDDMMKVLEDKQFWYDCSLEEGFQTDQDGSNNFWPYTLHDGSPGNDFLGGKAKVESHPGLWELPQYALIVPPDDKCEEYGTEPGLRDKLHELHSYFDVESGKMTSFDYNVWYQFKMTKSEALATLKYSFDLRMQGNRAPFFLGLHADEYSEYEIDDTVNADYMERREALEEFITYTLEHPDVRIVPAIDVLHWLRDPVGLDGRL